MFKLEISRRTPSFGETETAERGAIQRLLMAVANDIGTGRPLAEVNDIVSPEGGEHGTVTVGAYSFFGDAHNVVETVIDHEHQGGPKELTVPRAKAAEWLKNAERFSRKVSA